MRNNYKNINRFLIDKKVEEFSRNINEGENILDVGAGSGHYRKFFKSNTYIAIDMGLEQSDTKGLDVIGDICRIPFKTSSFKNMLCIEVFEHVWDSKHLLQELNRVLKINGHLFLTVPLCLGEHMQPFDFYRYTRYGLANSLAANGFEVIKMEPRGGFFILLAYLIAKIPDQISKAEHIPKFLRKSLKIISRFLFTYSIAPVLMKLDVLDSEKHFTLGYICEARKSAFLQEIGTV